MRVMVFTLSSGRVESEDAEVAVEIVSQLTMVRAARV